MAKFFHGTYHPKMDEKGRLFLPAKFRELLTDEIVLAPGQDNCLQVWPSSGFDKMHDQLSMQSQTNKDVRDYCRFLFPNSSPETVDKQGRVTINQNLKQYAKIDRDVVVIGVMNYVEIWDPKRWESSQENSISKFANLDGNIPGLSAE